MIITGFVFRGKMKWFFGFNEETDWFDNYSRYIKCAVNSCINNTNLEPNFIYDGKPNKLTTWLEEKGVTIWNVRSRFYDVFQKRADQGLNAKVASGAYLRAEIPDLVDGDSVVLYTDCDVMFIGDILPLSAMRPKYFACAPEFDQNNWTYFNSGVMVMNCSAMKQKMPQFERIVRSSSAETLSKSYDQYTYNELYKGRWDRLAPEYNWKPYWGLNPNAKIVHFHGIKVENIERILKGELVQPIQAKLFGKSPEGYKFYHTLAVRFEKI